MLPGPESIEASFDTTRNVVSLEGLSQRAKALKAILKLILDTHPSTRVIETVRPEWMQPSLSRVNAQSSQTSSINDCARGNSPQRIFAMSSTTDSLLIQEWYRTVVPFISGLLDRAVGSSYSASLVRQGSSECGSKVTVRIQCRRLPSAKVQSDIRAEVRRKFDNNMIGTKLQVKLSMGNLLCLAGWSDSDEDDEVDGSPIPYPNYKRYWRHAGMGASVGMFNDDGKHATLGCWIHVDGFPHFLTVKHFIKPQVIRDSNQGRDTTLDVMSPSYFVLGSLREDLKQFQRDNGNEIADEMARNGRQLSSSLVQASETLERLNGCQEKIQADLDACMRDMESYILGTVTYCSSEADIRLPLDPNADQDASSSERKLGHTMDWAVCRGVAHRIGMNRHRFAYDPITREIDFYDDGDEFGAGKIVEKVSSVAGNEHVHYVGLGSGRMSGVVNPARMLIDRNGTKSLEWTLIPSVYQSKESNQYSGDSGASIIRDSDNALIGHLWAYVDNQILFAPMTEIFEDIKVKAGTDNVCIAPVETPPRPPTAETRVPVTPVILTCGDKAKTPPNCMHRKADLSTIPWRPSLKKSLSPQPPKSLAAVTTELETPTEGANPEPATTLQLRPAPKGVTNPSSQPDSPCHLSPLTLSKPNLGAPQALVNFKTLPLPQDFVLIIQWLSMNDSNRQKSHKSILERPRSHRLCLEAF